jgi:group I intron endonuclease
MNYTVYKHTSPSGRVYIGITRRRPSKRYDRGKGYAHSPHFFAAIKKYGWENIKHEILAAGLSKEEAERREIELIAEYKSTDRRYGYNADKGGSAPGRMTEETRRKIAEHMRGNKNPTRRYGHPMRGKHHTEESKRLMAAKARARVGRHVTQETRAKLRQVQKKTPVIDLETGTIYEGIHTAAEATGLQPSKICAVCKGRRNKTGGKRWAYHTEILKEG